MQQERLEVVDSSVERPIRRIAADGTVSDVTDRVVGEEPLEIRIGSAPLAVLMRTPGHDLELAAGFLLTAAATYNIQKRLNGDSKGVSLIKALFCGAAVAVPFPIFGTLIGAAIASISGLSAVMDDPARRYPSASRSVQNLPSSTSI